MIFHRFQNSYTMSYLNLFRSQQRRVLCNNKKRLLAAKYNAKINNNKLLVIRKCHCKCKSAIRKSSTAKTIPNAIPTERKHLNTAWFNGNSSTLESELIYIHMFMFMFIHPWIGALALCTEQSNWRTNQLMILNAMFRFCIQQIRWFKPVKFFGKIFNKVTFYKIQW